MEAGALGGISTLPVQGHSCAAHSFHQPEPTYFEEHHVVPRAWQRFWSPPDLTKEVWFPLTVALCRTSHGNLHFWLVRLMKAWSGDMAEAAHLVREGAQTDGLVVGRKDFEIAKQGMTLWAEQGGSLEALRNAGLYGYI